MLFDIDFHGTPPTPFKRGKKGIYYTVQRIGGKQIWRSLRTTDRKTAEYLAMEKWRAMQTEAAKSIIPVPPIPLALIWTRYTQSQKYDLLEESTRITRARAWKAFVEYCDANGISSAKEVTPDIVTAFADRGGNAKNKYFNNLVGDISCVFSAYRDVENPCKKVERRSVSRGSKAATPYKELTRAQIANMLWAIRRSSLNNRREWFDACVVALETGARYKDVASLKYSDIQRDAKGAYLMFAPAKTANRTHNRSVLIRTTPTLESLLLRRQRSFGGDRVFPALFANIKQSTNYLAHFFKENHIEGSFHCFRVTVISAASRVGIDLKDFGGVVGHSTISQTNAYNRAALNIDLRLIKKGFVSK